MSRDENPLLHDALLQFVAHEYFRIDIHRVLEIVEHDLPPLEKALDRLA